MNFSDFEIVEEYEYNDDYSQDSQVSEMTFSTTYVDKENKKIIQNHQPFRCREYLSDWACSFTSGRPVSRYGFTNKVENCPEGYDPLKAVIAHGPKKELTRVWEVSRSTQFRPFMAWNKVGKKDVIVLEVPEKVFRSPFGIMLYTCLFRAMSHKKGFYSSPADLYISTNESSESDILRLLINAFPLRLVSNLMFKPSWYKFLEEEPESSSEDYLEGEHHSATGPRAMAAYILSNKHRREQTNGMQEVAVVVNQNQSLEVAMVRFSKGEH